MKNKLCAIVIPVYRQPNAYEKYSFETLINIVKDKYDIYLVCPEDYNTEYFGNKIIVKNLEKKWFESLQSYSNLCRENFFYKLFDKYKYMLIYQLDGFCFSDGVGYFMSLGYDYIGAPWINGQYIYKYNFKGMHKLKKTKLLLWHWFCFFL